MPEPLLTVVIATVARHYAVDPSSITSRSNLNSARVARSAAMYVARLVGDFSYPEIGVAFDRDHTTVMSACKRVAKRAARDPAFKQAVDGLVASVLSSGIRGSHVLIRSEILALLETQLKTKIFGRSIEDLVDRILCDYFQRLQLTGKEGQA